jgi:hypothetical protein
MHVGQEGKNKKSFKVDVHVNEKKKRKMKSLQLGLAVLPKD